MINMIVAMDHARNIGINNTLPWYLPEDLKHFKETTNGCVVVMGRNTYESIGKPLPDRRNIILTHRKDYTVEGVEVYNDTQVMWDAIKGVPQDIFVIGGAQVYTMFISLVDKIYVTYVDGLYEGDTKFPVIPKSFLPVSITYGERCKFVVYEKIKAFN